MILRLRFIIVAALMLAMATVGHADQSLGSSQKTWFQLYDEAIDHVERREWALAETKLQAAKRNGPKPDRRVLRYGNLRTPFFPDYYLGIVYQNTNRPKQALDAFQLARSQNIDTTARDFQQLDGLTRAAQAAVTESSTAKTNPPAPSPPAPTPATPSDKPAPETADTAAVQRKRFDDLLTEAQAQLGRRDFAAAVASAGQARDLQVDQTRVDALIRDIEKVSLSEQIQADIRSGDLSSAAVKLDRFKKLDATDIDAEGQRLTEDLRRAGSAQNAAALRATLERSAMQQFYSGDYQGAIRLIANLERAQALSPRAYFYRACSLAALALQSDDRTRLSDARQQYALSMRSAAELQRDRRFISPKILQALSSNPAY